MLPLHRFLDVFCVFVGVCVLAHFWSRLSGSDIVIIDVSPLDPVAVSNHLLQPISFTSAAVRMHANEQVFLHFCLCPYF